MQPALADLGRILRRSASALVGVVLAALLAFGGDRAAAQTAPANRWTFFVWMAADNDLEPQGIEDIKEMEIGIPEQGVEIIVFVDRFTPNNKRFGDWSGGRLYRIRPHRDRAGFGSELLQEFGPVNSSDPRLLADQMAAAFKRYPAERYGAILWNHGGGWASLAIDEHNPQSPGKSTGFTIMQIAEALRGGTQQAGLAKLDFIGFDMCLMAQLETAAELRDVGRLLVASQAIEPGTGWAYDRFLPVLERPETTPAELGQRIVDSFDEFNREAREPVSTLTAIDLDKIEPVLKGFDAVLAALQPQLPALWAPVNQSLFWAEGYATSGRIADLHGGENALASVDLVDVIRRMQANTPQGFPATAELQRLQAAVQAALVGNRNSDRHRASTGIALYAPVRGGSIGKGYAGTRLAKESRWLGFLQAVHAEASKGSKPPEVAKMEIVDAINGLQQQRGGLGSNSVLRVILRGESVLFATGTVLRDQPEHGRQLVETRGFLIDTEMAGERLAAAREAADLMVPQYTPNGAQLSMDAPGIGYVVAIGDRFAHASIDTSSFVNGVPQPKARAYVNAPGMGPVLSIIDFDPFTRDAIAITALVQGPDGKLTPRGVKPRPDLQILFLVTAAYPNDRIEQVPGGETMLWGKGPRLLLDLAARGKYLFQVGAESIGGAGGQKQLEFEIVEPDPGLMMFVHAARMRTPHSYAGIWWTEAGAPFGTLAPVADNPELLTVEPADARLREGLAKAGLRNQARIELRRMPTITMLTVDDRGAAKAAETGILYADPNNPDRIRIRTLVGRKGDPRGQSLVLVRQPGTGPAVAAAPALAPPTPAPPAGGLGGPIAPGPPQPVPQPTPPAAAGYINPTLPVGTWRGRTSANLATMAIFHANGSYQQQISYGPAFALDIVGRWSIAGTRLTLQPQSWSPTAYCVAPGQCQPIQLGGETVPVEFRNDGRLFVSPSFVLEKLP